MSFTNDATSGYKKYKNEKGWSLDDLYGMLKGVKVSFLNEEPVIDKVGKVDAVVYHIGGRFDIYASVDAKNIQVSRALAKGESAGKFVMKELGTAALSSMFSSGFSSKDTNEADRYVDELGDIIEQLLKGGVAESNVTMVSDEDKVSLYMKQQVFSIKDKYSICDREQNPKYYVAGNLTGLSFDVQTAAGESIYTIKKKMIAITPEYTLFAGKEQIGHIKKKIKLTRPEIVGDINGQELTIKGDMLGYSFSILLNGKVVGSVDTEILTWGDCYSIDILDKSLESIIVTIAVICDNTLKNKD